MSLHIHVNKIYEMKKSHKTELIRKKKLKDADFWLNLHYFISVTQDDVVWLSNRHVSLIS